MDSNDIENIPARTPDMIAAEIIVIREQAKKLLLISAVEIGRRLQEAKEKIPYGQFVTWVEETLQYSKSTAYNFMRLAEEYGPELFDAKTEPLSKLNYSQALILLGLPAEERAEFIAQLDIENTVARELQQAVSERNKALAEKAALQEEYDSHKSIISELSNERDIANKDAREKQKALWANEAKVTVLERKVNTLKNESEAGKLIAQIESESKIAKINLAMARADARYDLITKGFEDLVMAVKEMGQEDPEAFKLYLIQVNQFLSKTSERFKRIQKAVSKASEVSVEKPSE